MKLFRVFRAAGAGILSILPAFPGLFCFIFFIPDQTRAQNANSARSTPPGDGRTQKLRVFDRAAAGGLVSKGARLVADYGSFQVLEVEPNAAVAAMARGDAQKADYLDFIELNVQRLDTRAPGVKALRKNSGSFSGKQLHLHQFAGPVQPEWRKALEATGVQIVTYVPQNSYLVYGDAAAIGKMQAWGAANDYVQWQGKYLDDYKIHPLARTVDAKGQSRTPPGDLFTVQMVEDAAANPSTLALIDQMKIEPIRRQSRILNYLNVTVRLPPARLTEIAAHPEVVSIQPSFEPRKLDERQDMIISGNLSGGSPDVPTSPGYLAWLAGKGFTQAQFTASHFTVDVSDSGIDNGKTSPDHFGLYTEGNLSAGSRVIYNRLEGTPNGLRTGVICGQGHNQYGDVSSIQGWDGHGTLNSHIIAGYDNSGATFPHVDAEGYYYGLGVCPFVTVGSSVIFDPYHFTSPNYPTLQTAAYNNGARISNNSWGGQTNIYDTDAQSYDTVVRDVGVSGQNRGMVIVFAAGNNGPAAGTVASPGVAKNVITVGASENVRSLSTANGGEDAAGTDGSMLDDSVANDADSMANYSGQGPTSDGRLKPDLVAPGTHVTGGTPQNAPASDPTTSGAALGCFDAMGVSALPNGGVPVDGEGGANWIYDFFPLNQEFYTVSSGTSHATPAVSGACALLRQYFINQGLTPPSPAMTKAFLMNSARYLTGIGANDNLWSPSQGMGELNLGTAFDGKPRILQDQSASHTFTRSGQTATFTGAIADPSQPFRVTVAWTDAAGNTLGNVYNNDLDLNVTVAGSSYLGNVFSGAFSTTGGAADIENNVESVFLPAGTSGDYTVTITAANINSDAITNGGSVPEQDYALVIYNAAQVLDVEVEETVSSASATVGTNVTFTAGIANLGSATVSSLTLTDALPAGLTYVSAASSQGSVTHNGGLLTVALGALAGGASASVTLQTTATLAGTWVNTIGISPPSASDISSGSASSTVSVTAVSSSAPVIKTVVVANNNVVITWSATAGRSYQVQFKSDLSAMSWTSLTPDITAAGASASVTNALSGEQRFYRVLLLP